MKISKNVRSVLINLSDLYSPDGFLQRVEELEAEAILLRGSLNKLARIEKNGAHPVICFRSLID